MLDKTKVLHSQDGVIHYPQPLTRSRSRVCRRAMAITQDRTDDSPRNEPAARQTAPTSSRPRRGPSAPARVFA